MLETLQLWDAATEQRAPTRIIVSSGEIAPGPVRLIACQDGGDSYGRTAFEVDVFCRVPGRARQKLPWARREAMPWLTQAG